MVTTLTSESPPLPVSPPRLLTYFPSEDCFTPAPVLCPPPPHWCPAPWLGWRRACPRSQPPTALARAMHCAGRSGHTVPGLHLPVVALHEAEDGSSGRRIGLREWKRCHRDSRSRHTCARQSGCCLFQKGLGRPRQPGRQARETQQCLILRMAVRSPKGSSH